MTDVRGEDQPETLSLKNQRVLGEKKTRIKVEKNKEYKFRYRYLLFTISLSLYIYRYISRERLKERESQALQGEILWLPCSRFYSSSSSNLVEFLPLLWTTTFVQSSITYQW